MPAKNIESLNIDDEYVMRWLRSLYEPTAVVYGTRFRKFFEWCKENNIWGSGEEIIVDAKKCLTTDELYDNHLAPIMDFINQLGTTSNDRKATFNCIKSFYEHYRITLPKLTSNERKNLFRANQRDWERAKMKPLELEEVKQIIMNLKQPYKAAYMLMFQSALGSAEFDQLNTGEEWKNLVKQVDNEGPAQLNLIRVKTSTEKVREYYTFVSKDTKDLIREWLKMRPKEADEANCLFCVWYKNKHRYVPLTSYLVGIHVNNIAKRLGIIKQNELGCYHTHLHEVRDLFKSLCSLNGVNVVAAEFFLGHVIDKLGYDKSPKYDVDFFREEYIKVAPVLNLFSTNGEVKKKVDDENRDLREKMEKMEKAFDEAVRYPNMDEKMKKVDKLLELMEKHPKLAELVERET